MGLRSAGRNAIAKAAIDLKPFKQGNISGTNQPSQFDYGWLNGDDREEWQSHCKNGEVVYAFYSWQTPIVYLVQVTPTTRKWVSVTRKFPPTTTHHRHAFKMGGIYAGQLGEYTYTGVNDVESVVTAGS